ncbi:unnamed protein product [Ilex paraguariensis]|uniref:Uncharacterized protein n=1 Tax=Ilex paraguariensis TaxID=185542 RepID=A0ABC8RDJ7_9AQUA
MWASATDSVEQNSLQTYIVHVKMSDNQVFTHSEDLKSWYQSFLSTTTASSNEPPHIMCSYRNVVTGFAAKLSLADVKAMEKKDGFVAARPQRVLSLHTTHTPNFLGLHQNLGFWNSSNYGKGVIIGVLDTGIFPNHPSFSDEGMPSPPAKWKGKCKLNSTFSCNNKLIGVRNFVSAETEIAFDDDGHGTHTASTAARNFVKGANVFGNANGTAVDSDILAAMDAAIEEGVDVLSLSLGGISNPCYDDSIALGAFSAMQKGIFVSCSAGNRGPINASLANDAPWILTVGASTMDRSIRATALLGNTEEFNGESLFQPKDFLSTLLPLVYPRSNSSRITQTAPLCGTGSLNNTDVVGKVVICEVGGSTSRIAKGQTVKDAGGAAMILITPESRALLKSSHPDWSVAAIKSAIMTTADQLNLANKPILDERLLPANIFAIGAGHVNPSRANDPGLVYDVQPDEYILYLCGLNYTNRQISVITQQSVNCSVVSTIPEAQLNYPSFAITLGSTNQTNTRTVTNVGKATSTYTVEIVPPQGVDVRVTPSRLDFTEMNQKITYQVTFRKSITGRNTTSAQGFLRWTSVKHIVRSPISVIFK